MIANFKFPHTLRRKQNKILCPVNVQIPSTSISNTLNKTKHLCSNASAVYVTIN